MEKINVELTTFGGKTVNEELLVSKLNKNEEKYQFYNKDKTPFTKYNNSLMKSRFTWIDGKIRICKPYFIQRIDAYNLIHITR